jgi:hypothetical protein
MPTLPLYTPNSGHPDASHAVIAPGGYERWYFDAESAAGDLQVVAVFSLGTADHPDHATYLRHYRYYSLFPTRRRPPVPAEWSAVSLAVYWAGAQATHFVRACAPGEFHAAPGRLDLSAGPDRVCMEPDGSMRLRLEARGADLTFRPLWAHRARVVDLFPRPRAREKHYWIVAAPCCAVEGSVQVGGGRTVAFSGRGYHDHHFGTTPIGSWMRGRIFGQAGVTAFYINGVGQAAGPRRYPAEAHCLDSDAEGVRDAATLLRLEGNRCPTSIEFNSTGVRLSEPRVLDRSGTVGRVAYEVSAEKAPGLDGRTAFCEWV